MVLFQETIKSIKAHQQNLPLDLVKRNPPTFKYRKSKKSEVPLV
jgi:hypothetical protein